MEVTAQEANKLTNGIAERLHYIAKLNPRGVNRLASKYGYPVPSENVASKFNFLSIFFQENGGDDSAIDELLMTHPDFNLLAETLSNKVKSKMGTNKKTIQIDNDEEPFVSVEDFEGFDGFIDNMEIDSHDNMFIDAIATGLGAVAGGAGKFAGTGKRGRAATQNLAEENTKQLKVQQRGDKLVEKQKTKRIIIYSSLGLVAVVIMIFVYIFVIRKK